MDFSGDFETHLTVEQASDALVEWASERGLKYAHIVLDRGRTPSQPMLTLRTRGTLPETRTAAEHLATEMRSAGFTVTRLKIEAAPWNDGVPHWDRDALGPEFYFEHHVKLLLPADADLTALADLAGRHSAHLSRNARRVRPDGLWERFVTQRCRGVGANTAQRRLAALLTALGDHETDQVEREYVVHDDAPSLDAGWIDEEAARPGYPRGPRLLERLAPSWTADAAEATRLGLPPTLRFVPEAMQFRIFDPALKQYDSAYRASEPYFTSPDLERRWYAARRQAIDQVLVAVEHSVWADRLVLRGSVLLRAWYGELAREPGDLDFIVPAGTPDPERALADIAQAITDSHKDTAALRVGAAVGAEALDADRLPDDGAQATTAVPSDNAAFRAGAVASAEILDADRLPDEGARAVAAVPGDTAALRADEIVRADAPDTDRVEDDGAPGVVVTLVADEAVVSDIWTYERVPGRRLVIPWRAEGVPPGTVQLDFTFGETLPADPAVTEIPRADGGPAVRVLAATPETSLAWKIVWLLDDAYPQGKDLYDAWLLARHCRPSHRLLMRALVLSDPTHATRPLEAAHLTGLEVDWKEFRKEYPEMPDEPDGYLRDLLDALTPALAEAADLPTSGYERTALLLEPQIDAYGAVLADHGRDEVIRQLVGCHLPVSVVIVRELDGRAEDIDAIAAELLRAWGRLSEYGQPGYYHRNPDRLTADLEILRT